MSTYSVSCSSCGAVNRVPADKEGKTGRCGSCRARLTPLYFRPQQLAERSFDPFIAGYPGPILAVFWAPW